MIVRALDANHDWTFGAGKNNYLSGADAVTQNIDTRLNSFLGDCFFDTQAGIDWFNLNGGKSKLAILLAVTAQIQNTQYVTQILELSVNVNNTRNITIVYSANTAFGPVSNTLVI